MADSPTGNLGLHRLDTGDNSSTWGALINENATLVDAAFDPATGHNHDGTTASGGVISHLVLTEAGSLTHTAIDSALTAHSATIASLGTAAADLTDRVTVLESGLPDITYLPSTYPPVAWSDNFAYKDGYDIGYGNYRAVANDARTKIVCKDGYAVFDGDPRMTGLRQAPIGRIFNTIRGQIPHALAQRVSAVLARWNLENLETVGDGLGFTLAALSAPLAGSSYPVQHGLQLQISVALAGTGPKTYDVTKTITLVIDDEAETTFYSDHQAGLTEAEALIELLGEHELAVAEDGSITYLHRYRPLFVSAVGALTDTWLTALQAALDVDGEPLFGSMGFGAQYQIDPADDTAHTDLVLLGFAAASAGAPSSELGKNTSAATNIDVVVARSPLQIVATGSPWGTTFIGDIVEILGVEYKIVSAYDGSFVGFVIAELTQQGQAIGATAIPSNEMATTAAEYDYTLALDGVAPADGQEPVPSIPANTAGQVLRLHAVQNIPPYVRVTSSTEELTIKRVQWVDHNEIWIYFDTTEDAAGESLTLTLTDPVHLSNTIAVPLGTIVVGELHFVSATFYRDGVAVSDIVDAAAYTYSIVVDNIDAAPGALDATQFDIQVPDDASLTGLTATLGADGRTVTGAFSLAYGTDGNQTLTLVVVNPGPPIDRLELKLADVGISPPVLSYASVTGVDPTAAATIVFTGTGITDGGTLELTADVGSAPTAAGSPAVVGSTQITVGVDSSLCTPGAVITAKWTNPDAQDSNELTAYQISMSATATISTATIGTYYYEGQEDQDLEITGGNLDPGCRVICTNITGCNIRVVSVVGNNTINALIDLPTGSGGQTPNIRVINPSGLMADTTAAGAVGATPTPTIGAVTFDNGLTPGTSGELTVDGDDFLPGMTLTSSNDVTDLVLGEQVSFTPADGPGGQIVVAYKVPTTAVPGTTVSLTATNPLGAGATDTSETIDALGPVIYSLRVADTSEGRTAVPYEVIGENFPTATVVTFGAPATNNVQNTATATRVTGIIDHPSTSGGSTVNVMVSDGFGNTATASYGIVTLTPPIFEQFILTPNEEGVIGADIILVGQNLYPAASFAVAASKLTNIVWVTQTPRKWTGTCDISGAAGDKIDVTIDYLGRTFTYDDVAEIGEASVGTPTITGFDLSAPVEGVLGQSFTIDGTFLSAVNVDEVAFAAEQPTKLAIEYAPVGAQDPITNITILTQSYSQITGTLDIPDHGLARRTFELQLLLSAVLQTSMASAMTVAEDPAFNALTNESTLDTAISTTASASVGPVTLQYSGPILHGPFLSIQGTRDSIGTPLAGFVAIPVGPANWQVSYTNPTTGGKVELRVYDPTQGQGPPFSATAPHVVYRYNT